ncbi:MAG: EAL domain-containing protein [Novosphingobium sp.]
MAGKVVRRAKIVGTASDAVHTGARDAVTLGIAASAILLFVGTGGQALRQVIKAMQGQGIGPDNLLVSALLLNVALILLGWRHYRQLAIEVNLHRLAEAQAKQLADRDHLTGFLNRRSLSIAADELIAACAARGEAVALMMADLDSFKQINDVHGHGVGDNVLQQCARRIAENLPARAVSARIGGDEFACLIPFDTRHPESLDEVVSRLIGAVAQPAQGSEAQIDVTISIGICRNDGPLSGGGSEATVTAMLHSADIAMYHAKRKGRNRYFWFETSMETEMRVRRELEAGIRAGIPLGEFVPYYEQQIDLKTGKLTGFEMLARWNSPNFGIVGPQIFIPVAEEIGLIGQMSEGLIAQALQDAKAWDPGLTLSVNISPIQFRDPWFSQKLLKLLVEANFPPKRLEIEITESCLHENFGAVRTLLASLKNQGIRISLDDFGTGYSSFSQLSELPIDSIKIDRSFVQKLNSGGNATIVKAISTMGAGMGLPVTAEGIESAEVLKELQTFGDFRGQGYLYGLPEPAAETNKRLADLNLLADSPRFNPAKLRREVRKAAVR